MKSFHKYNLTLADLKIALFDYLNGSQSNYIFPSNLDTMELEIVDGLNHSINGIQITITDKECEP